MVRTVLLAVSMLMASVGAVLAQQNEPVRLALSNVDPQHSARSTQRQGQVLADILKDRNITGVAVTYISNGYGQTLETAFAEAFKAHGGRVAISLSYRDNEEDYFAEVGALSAAGVEYLVVLGHLERGGLGIVETALDTGSFEKFVLGEGMIGDQLIQTLGSQLEGTLGAQPNLAVLDTDAQQVQSQMRTEDDPLLPGELSRAVDIVKQPHSLELDGSASLPIVPLDGATSAYREIEVKNGKFETVKIR